MRARPSIHLVIATSVGALSLVAARPVGPGGPGEPRGAEVDFALDVRPVLSDRCFRCHGPDAAARKAHLRLDTFEGATADRGGYAAIVPGDSEASELVRRLRESDTGERMPPASSNLEVSAAELARLVRWIDTGATYAEHWAFAPPRRAAEAGAPASIDAFLEARLAEEGLEPAPPADRGTWLRRASLDLTGLPPSVEELDRFLAGEPTEAAWAAEVQRLLASPRFGERMAADWLDLARYADTYGYQNDVARRVWPWRDWLIDAFNANLPYDEFATAQLAGDLLPAATRETRLATAFLRLHRQTNEGGSVEEEFRLEYVADRVHTVGTAFLGLTLECARCHDHKFDPISQEEYYRLSAYFDDIDESGLYSHFTDAVPTPTLDLPSAEQEAELSRLTAEVHAAEDALAAALEVARARALAAAEPWRPAAELVAAGLVAHFPLDDVREGRLANLVDPATPGALLDAPTGVPGAHGSALRFSGDDNANFPGVGAFHRSDPFTLSLDLRLEHVVERAVVLHRSRAWTDAGSRGYQLLLEDGRPSFSLIHFWPGNAVRIRALEPLPVGEWCHLAMTHDGSGRAAGLGLWRDGERLATEVVRDGLTRRITGGGESALTLAERFRDRGLVGGAIDEVRVYARELHPAELRHEAGGTPLAEALAPLEDAAAFHAFALDAEVAAAREHLRASRRALCDLRDAIPEIMTMAELPAPRTAQLLARGSYLSPVRPVTPGTPTRVFPLDPELPPNRLGLAAWLTSPRNPLFARVAVNRLWQLAFGRGLVATPENFGSQGEPPSHPALLDWLALEFIGSGYDVKAMLARLLRSRAYRGSARVEPGQLARDPANALLARAPRPRLSAEAIRDSALFVSGLLVEQIGGPSVKPYQPPGLWKEKSGLVYERDHGAGLYRRSLYTFWKRTSPPPAMTVFDATSREVCVARRRPTNTPQQALALWNDPQRIEAARVFAQRLLGQEHADDRARCDHAFRAVLGRTPSDAELAVLLEALAAQHAAFDAAPAEADALLSVGDAARDATLEATEVAAWTTLTSTLLSHDGALTRD